MNDTFWIHLRRIAWPATAGFLASGLLFGWQGSMAMWLAFTAGTVWVLARHRQQPIALIPST